MVSAYSFSKFNKKLCVYIYFQVSLTTEAVLNLLKTDWHIPTPAEFLFLQNGR